MGENHYSVTGPNLFLMKIKHTLLLVGLGWCFSIIGGLMKILHLRHTIFCLLLLLGAMGASRGQNAKDPRIQNIRNIFQRINNDRTIRVVSMDYEEITGEALDNGGDVKGYFKKDTLCKMIMTAGPSYGLVTYEYYFNQGQPVFIYELEKRFPIKADGSRDDTKLVQGFEGRYYLDKGKLISKVVKGKKFGEEPINDEYIKERLDITIFTQALRKKLSKPK